MARYEKVLVDRHTGEQVFIRCNDPFLLQEKIEKKFSMWNRRAEAALAREAREEKRAHKQAMMEEATRRTEKAQMNIEDLRSILDHALKMDGRLDWDALMNKFIFREFILPHPPHEKQFTKNIPSFSALELLWHPLKDKRMQAEKQARSDYEIAVTDYTARVAEELKKWNFAKSAFEKSQHESNQRVTDLKTGFESGSPDAIIRYVELVLDKSIYPEHVEPSFDVQFDAGRKVLKVDVDLPHPSDLPSVIEYKYSPAKDELVEKEMKPKEFDELYDDVVTQIVVRTIHEIFESVYTSSIDHILLNGWVRRHEKKSGRSSRACIVSVQAPRDTFQSMDLRKVSPTQCLAKLRAEHAGSFDKLEPVHPLAA